MPAISFTSFAATPAVLIVVGSDANLDQTIRELLFLDPGERRGVATPKSMPVSLHRLHASECQKRGQI